MHCPKSPDCPHHWYYDFRANRKRISEHDGNGQQAGRQEVRSENASRILDGRHSIREQPDITFKAFAGTYLQDYAEQRKRSVDRDREIIKVLNRAFGSLILHEITAHRIEQFKRERLAGKWRGHGHTSSAKPIKPATVNRELDTLRSVFSKAVEWGKVLAHPMRNVKRLKVDNRRTRILSEDEQDRILAASPRKLGRLVTLALMTGARIGELLELRWEDVADGYLTFMETKNGKARRIPISASMQAVFDATTKARRRTSSRTFAHTNPTPSTAMAHVFKRAVDRGPVSRRATSPCIRFGIRP